MMCFTIGNSKLDEKCSHFNFYQNSVRKNAEELKKDLERVVVPMFCNASVNVSEDQLAKLNKVS
jgi:hypothetical protein